MGLLHLALAALAATAVFAADKPCGCVSPDQKLDPIKNPMLFFQQPTLGAEANGVACPMNCTLTAHAADEDKDGLVIQLLANGLGAAKITVIDGVRTWLITKNTDQSQITWRSTTGVLVFEFEGEVSPAGTFMIVVQKSATGRDPTPSVVPVTVPSPTPPFDTIKYTNNPLLVANDIMIVFDLSNQDVPDLKQFATDLINTLTITNATDCGVGTRLALHGLTNFDGFSPEYYPDWHYTQDVALGHIGSMVQIGDGPYNLASLADTVNSGFKDNSAPTSETDPNTIESRCLNRGRVFILLSPQQPAEWQPEKGTSGNLGAQKIVDFIGRGVHPILVTSLKDKQRDYYDQYTKIPTATAPSNRWTYFNIDDGVTKFINNYLVDTTPDLSCQLAKDTKVSLTKTSISNAEKISIPPYYEGMITGKDEDFTSWDTVKHYCNFQKTTVSIEQVGGDDESGKADVCIKVYYDLETDSDFVDIYGGDYLSGTQKHIVRLTGRDVSGSKFQLGNRVGQIVFTSDEKNVFDGFYAEFTPCGADYKQK